MNALKMFEHECYGKIRVVDIDGEPWFVGKDIALALGYKQPEHAIKRHCTGCMKRTPIQTRSGTRDTRVLKETDVYALVMHSTLPGAEKFQQWVYDVIAQLRKTGVVDLREQKAVTGNVHPAIERLNAVLLKEDADSRQASIDGKALRDRRKTKKENEAEIKRCKEELQLKLPLLFE